MKKLGLVGGTGPESTLLYYSEVNKRVHALTAGTEFPEIAIESLNLNKALGLVAQEKYEALETYLIAAIQHLEASGADVGALTAATMHVIFEKVRAKASVPIVGIPEAVAEVAVARGYQKVGLLGTIFTMEKDYLKKTFAEKGIDVVIPSPEDRKLVHTRITTELEYAIIKESSCAELIAIIEKMRIEAGIGAVILGRTELPLALNQENCPVDCLDIVELHIGKLVKMITA